jgi:glycosyltransferase involved in cell wall biosynthesis
MLKLIIQIPCHNEAATLPLTLADLPRQLEGVDVVEWLVIDDGSTDDTLKVARKLGVDHVIRHTRNQGLARAFQTGINACLMRNADVIVHTDADNQYSAADIPNLVAPILNRTADLVIGERPIWNIKDFSILKRVLQKIGSWTVRWASGTRVQDAPSGFRAFSREAALKLNVFNEYTYTLETIIQAGHSRMAVVSVPIDTNEKSRDSRLIRSVPDYLMRCGMTILRTFVTYQPFASFAVPGAVAFLVGLAIGLRFLVFYFADGGQGHIQSLILAGLLLGSGFFLITTGLVADLVAVNRRLLEEVVERVRRLEAQAGRQSDLE